MAYGAGGEKAADTLIERHIAGAAAWDPPPLEPSASASTQVSVDGAAPGDIAVASHSGVVDAELQLTAAAANGSVAVLLRNAGGEAVDVPPGRLTVLVTKLSLL